MATTAELPVTLDKDEILRYSRHLIMPEVGMEGQQKLKAAQGAVHRHRRTGLAARHVSGCRRSGHLGLVDFDVVDYQQSAAPDHPLDRRRWHAEARFGELKLKGLNPNLNVIKFDTMLPARTRLKSSSDFDIIADGTDNFPTRYLVNDACVLLGKPNVYASIYRFEGQASVFATEDGSLLPLPLSRAATTGPGTLLRRRRRAGNPSRPGRSDPGHRVIKLILGIGDPLIGRLLLIDALGMKFRELKLRKNPDCPVCGAHPTVTKLIDYNEFCGIRGEEKPVSNGVPEIQVEELKRRLDAKEDLFVLDVREPHEYQICNLGGYLIPLNDLPKRVNELDSSREIVVHCKMGGRSAKAVQFLQQSGFTKIHNLAGGITAWSDRVDPKVPKY